jgi:hypothetical protein
MIKRTLQLVIFTALLIVTTSMAADARVRTNLWITMPPWGLSYPYYAPYQYPYYPYYHEPRQIIIEKQPDTYIQQEPSQPPEKSYWYYCPSPQGYYPAVKECPAGWLKVVPTTPDDAPPSPR